MALRGGPARREFTRHADAGFTYRGKAGIRMPSELGMRMPALPIEVDPATPLTGPSLDDDEDASPHRRVTADLRGAIACGAIQPGDVLPTLAEIARRYDVATSTVHRPSPP